jgi:hypothetical protein
MSNPATPTSVILNLFQDPSPGLRPSGQDEGSGAAARGQPGFACAARWTLKQVQGDGDGKDMRGVTL